MYRERANTSKLIRLYLRLYAFEISTFMYKNKTTKQCGVHSYNNI